MPDNIDKSLDAVAFEIVAIGEFVQTLKVGHHCRHISAAGDHIPSEYIIVREEDVICHWDPADAE